MIYGPVLSRRFGYSLGIDIIPYKTCSYDCIYCQLGKTTNKTVTRKRYIDINIDGFLKDLKGCIRSKKKIDYITFSGSGEPTLNIDIKTFIEKIKEMTGIPLVLLTNGSLFYKEEIINAIRGVDLIKVSLDASDESCLRRINNPHPGIDFLKVLNGLNLLLYGFTGRIWFEIMLIKGINDDIEQVYKLKKIIDHLDTIRKGIEKIHLNTPVRPPGSEDVLPPEPARIYEIKKILGKKAEVIQDMETNERTDREVLLGEDVIELVKRRPVMVKEISDSLRVSISQVIKCVRELLSKKKIKYKFYKGNRYYYL
jgi:wyosine [tRNA(Phe)-imidazoG37] synthetase (radical SAM superfamily)